MSFYRITDPKKRDAMVADYVATVKRIKQRNLNERLGDLAHQSELNETVNPIIESNEKTATAITNELKPMKMEIRDLNKHLRGQDLIVRGRKRKNDDGEENRDMYFGIHGEPAGGYSLGNKRIIVDGENNIHVENELYKGTSGLWGLIFHINPKEYTIDDWTAYKKLVKQTNLINNPSGIHLNSRPKLTKKYKLLMKALREDEEAEEEEGGEGEETSSSPPQEEDGSSQKKEVGSGIVSILPGTIKGLLDKLKLLFAEFIAGNTTTRNELVAVLDQLRKQGRITEKQYTTINTFLSRK